MVQLIAYPQGTDLTASGFLDNTILDLYADTPIPLTLTIDNFTNVLENTSSYSLPMDLPGTKTNNKFFTFIYEITADSNFNPHTRTPIKIKQGTVDTFSGYMQLINIIKKDGAISYKVILFSEAINLKDSLAENKMRALDFSELDHKYDSINIIDSWTGVLALDNPLPANSLAGSGSTTDVVKYPAVRWNTNVTFSSGTVKPDDLSDMFRPWLNLKYVLGVMFRASGFSFTSAFFNTPAFDNLYVDFNKGWETLYSQAGNFTTKNNLAVSYTAAIHLFECDTIIDNYAITGSNYYDVATNVFTCTAGTISVSIQWDIHVGSGTAVKAYIFVNGLQYQVMGQANAGGTIFDTWGAAFIWVSPGDTIEIKVKSTSPFTLSAASQVDYRVTDDTVYINDTLDGYKGDTNQWDFLKGVIDMFKLIVMKDDNDLTNLLIEPYKDWVDSGKLIDLSNKVDDKNFKYSMINGLAKELKFTFGEDEPDWITLNHNHPNEWKYSYNLITPLELFDKELETVEAAVFSTTYVVANGSLGGEFYCPAIINNDTSLSNWENKWRILYDNGVHTMASDILKVQSFNLSYYLLFSNTSIYPIIPATSLGYDFGLVRYVQSSGNVVNSLFNVYWLRYIDELYHKDTRIIKLTAFLKAADIYNIQFNDVILIRNRKYRVSKIEYRAGGKSKLELINIKDL
tara:strand:- start:4052 stop:6103 length:2052 start_codon:yes stop_codon:yes gene_type:complete